MSSATEAAEFTIDISAGTIKSASGYYIGNTSSSSNQTLSSTTTAYTNTISYNNAGYVDIIASCGNYLRYNTDGYFRYYKSSSYDRQKAIQLYKKVTVPVSEPIDPRMTFASQSVNLFIGDTFTQTVDTDSDGEVTYSITPAEGVATIDGSTGEVTALGVGTAVVTATVDATSSYNVGSAYYTLIVKARPGDIDNNGTLDSADLAALVQILIGGDTTGCDLDAADVNNDSTVSIADLTALVNLLNEVEE